MRFFSWVSPFENHVKSQTNYYFRITQQNKTNAINRCNQQKTGKGQPIIVCSRNSLKMVFVKEGHPKSAPIEITYYVSPHEFWFKYENDHDETAEDELMQRRIDRLAEESRSDRNNNALKVGDIVIAQCIPMNLKYIRARIDYVFTYATGTEFVLWAIDYG